MTVAIKAASLGLLVLFAQSCTYLKYAGVQSEYARIQEAEPTQLNVKHMIERDTFFVHGRCIDPAGRFDTVPKTIAAFSSKYQANELVATMHFQVAGLHYGLNLPDGTYQLLVLADLDGDGLFESSEVIGSRTIELNNQSVPQKVLGQVDVTLSSPYTIDWNVAIEVPDSRVLTDSLFYPAGTIRSLDDPIFDHSFSTLGMYDPASFLEQAPTMFYALEEDLGYKIPVIFVHGIGGSARDFTELVGRLDRSRYKPWFFYYPSGGDLEQMAELFYQVFLSGEVYQSHGMPLIVVAHSMGGLVARQALNNYRGKANENEVHLLITMASPFGGHPSAPSAETQGLIVLPSWRDLNPASPFIDQLFAKPLPPFVQHDLIYAFQDPSMIKLGENSDSVVPLSSQLDPRAQRQASDEFGFDTTHSGILINDEVADYILAEMDTVRNLFPADHLAVFHQGGYSIDLNADFEPVSAYYIRVVGKYLMALTDGTLVPINEDQIEFAEVARGQRRPRNETEQDWLTFIARHPELRDEP